MRDIPQCEEISFDVRTLATRPVDVPVENMEYNRLPIQTWTQVPEHLKVWYFATASGAQTLAQIIKLC